MVSFLGFFVIYTLRVNLSVALVAMVNQTALNAIKQANGSDKSSKSICLASSQFNNETTKDHSKMVSFLNCP